jgi:hypothetical protein
MIGEILGTFMGLYQHAAEAVGMDLEPAGLLRIVKIEPMPRGIGLRRSLKIPGISQCLPSESGVETASKVEGDDGMKADHG